MSETNDHSGDIIAVTETERAALAAVNAYLDAWNRHDVPGTDAALHFPHVRLASGRVTVLDGPGSLRPDFFEQFVARTGWHHSLWDYRRAVQSGPDKVHFAVQFSRYRADGTKIGSYPSMWVVTFVDGRWGVQARSSFAP